MIAVPLHDAAFVDPRVLDVGDGLVFREAADYRCASPGPAECDRG
jgi:hypothetical protein